MYRRRIFTAMMVATLILTTGCRWVTQVDKTESVGNDNAALEEQYLESVRKLAVNHVDLFGDEVESMNDKPEENHFAILDIDRDGSLELILSWTDATMAGMWGGVYQYDFESKEYIDEGLCDPGVTFYDNGVVYVPWRHNQGPSEMWPFDAYVYNADTDRYDLGIIVDSWSRNMREEGFPTEIDTENAGVVYYVYKGDEELDYEHPICQSEFDEIYNQYFDDAKVVSVDYFELSEQGIQEYLDSK